jgi:hypothetical protein
MAWLNPSQTELPYQSGSFESREAAIAALPSAARGRQRVYQVIAGRGRYGATQREIAALLDLPRATVAPRCRELELDQVIVKADARRDGCRVYVVRELA